MFELLLYQALYVDRYMRIFNHPVCLLGPVHLFRTPEYARADLQQFEPNVEFLLRHFLENCQIQTATAALYSVQ